MAYQALTTKQDGVDTVAAADVNQLNENIEVVVESIGSGWVFDLNTWTYASATSFTVPGDQRAMFTKGRKIGAYQGSAWVWGTVLSSTYGAPNTTVNLIPNTSYSLANAVISQAIYNIIENPNTFPEYFNYSPTIASGAGSITSYTVNFARFKVIGNMVHVSCHFTITNNGTGSGDIRITTPIVAAISAYGAGREIAAVGNMINIQTTTGAATFELFTVTNTYPGGTGYQIMFSIGYLI